MSLLKRKEAQALLKDAQVEASTVRGCRQRLTVFGETVSSLVLSGGTTGTRPAFAVRPSQSFAAQDLRADRVAGGRGASADPMVRRRRQVGRRSGHGGSAPAQPHGKSLQRLVVIRTVEDVPKTHYCLSNAQKNVPVEDIVWAHDDRHPIEEMFQLGNGEVGLDHYEVPSWVGWHHHMTLSLLGLWFLVLERERVGKKTPAITVPQVRQIFSHMVQQPPPTAETIAATITSVLQRNEEGRICHWYAETETFPPRRTRSRKTDSS
jgi:hypothetical protein